MPFSRFNSHILAPIEAVDLVPPPRFRDKSFASYRVDASIPGQLEAVGVVRSFAARRSGFFDRLRGGTPGLYLDGGFGVGKTHLLAAAFNVGPGRKRYLSFAEAMSLMTVRGPKVAIELLAADLVCIDEFELDDPTNTRLADLLVSGLMERRGRIITTSNTVPGELGQGRMAIELFRTQLARIETSFTDVHVPGGDWRMRSAEGGQPPRHWGPDTEPLVGDGCLTASAEHLDRWLRDIPVINLRRLAAVIPGLTIEDVVPFDDQLRALRFVHLIDKLYDYGVVLRVRSRFAIADLFPPEHCQASFAKKYRRCQSRLTELCA